MITVPRIDNASLVPEIFIEKYQKTGTPVIITGLLDKECDWNLQYLCKMIGDCQLPFRTDGSQHAQDDKRQLKSIGSGITPTQIIFKQYADMLRSGYAHKHNITLRTYPIKNTMFADTKLAEIGTKLGLYKAASGWNLHIAPGGYNSVLHYDAMDGTLMQMHGAKKVILFPPSQTYNLYPFPIYTHVLHGLKLRC